MTSLQEFEPIHRFSTQEPLAQTGIRGEPSDPSVQYQDHRYPTDAEPYAPVPEVDMKRRREKPLPKGKPEIKVTIAASIADLTYSEANSTQEAPRVPILLDPLDPNIHLF